ncbi:MAG: redox-regulated ATPase YchF [Euryarchaeota archaeon]|nr:redox-regulated ATPase YchF [Euryarchaeota archaeon]|tara:strand:- start:235 stop:1494 length:1260 start_codon:yes stop_codon:yes gene_type:complete
MKIGLVGKPNVGKSTVFSALTQINVDIGNYPFTTIDPNIGVTLVQARHNCPITILRNKFENTGREIELECVPRTGICNNDLRYVPVTLVDVAGLVPGAHEGKGRGNQFLSDLSQCDALIQVIDASCSTDLGGNPIGKGACNPIEEHNFLISELASWILGILNQGWVRGVRRVQSDGDKGLISYLNQTLTGIGANEHQILIGFNKFKNNNDTSSPWDWSEEKKHQLSLNLREEIFPLYVAANKADIADINELQNLIKYISDKNSIIFPTSADSELALRRAKEANLIDYELGSNDFKVTALGNQKLSSNQINGLGKIKNLLTNFNGTGFTKLLDQIIFDNLNKIIVYPVQDENKWADGDGKILPDALLVDSGITAKGLAYEVHTDLGDGFIKAVDCKTSRIIGADHELLDGDVIKIHSKSN